MVVGSKRMDDSSGKEMAYTGTLKKFMEGKGFGFTERDYGQGDVFCHFSQLTGGSSEDLVVGSKRMDDRSGKEMAYTGTLKKILEGKGFGFIERDDGLGDVF